MTVICINNKWTHEVGAEGIVGPSIGDKETVIDILVKHGDTYYILERYGNGYGFMTSHFVDIPEHPDTALDYYRLKQIQKGGQQATEDKAIEAYLKAYEVKGKEEAERIYFSFFNKKSHDRKQKSTGVSGS